MDYRDYIYMTLDKLKTGNNGGAFISYPVFGDSKYLGVLKPITNVYRLIYPEYVTLVCKWRQENQEGFANRFEGTEEKTRNWFDKVLLPRKDRVLFMFHDFSGKPIGHMGYSNFDFDRRSAEIDNVVKGEKKGYDGYFHKGIEALISIGKKLFQLDEIELRVLKDNEHAIKFYEELKFVREYEIPLYEKKEKDLISWVEMDKPGKRKPDKYYIHMKLC